MPNTQAGATPDQWGHFEVILGLGRDLLPIVCNHNAKISPQSNMKRLGKVPSLYNKAGQAVGILDWTQKQSTAAEIAKWSKNHDYGICIQTRLVRAIDVDVPDQEQAQLISDFIDSNLGQKLSKRMRSNSGKFLLVFEMSGEHHHAEIPVEGGIIEFLANNQQFVACGRHQSGVPYEFEGGLPHIIPALSESQFNALWEGLIMIFSNGVATRGSGAARKREPTVEKQDPITDYLNENNLVLSVDRNKSLLIKCPFDAEHTQISNVIGDGSTIYMPAGTNGYQQGHFKCLHAHCKNRKDEDFVNALGIIANAFEIVNPVASQTAQAPAPSFSKDRKTGRIFAIVENICKALRYAPIAQWVIGLDLFRDEIMRADPATMQWVPFKDADYTRLRIEFGNFGFYPIGREMIRDCVQLVADENKFDSAQIWLESLQWDNKPRIGQFLTDYMGVEDTPYTRAVSSYLWTAMAGRVMQPGCKCDMVPILVGPQGRGKSSGVAAMVPSLDFFTEISFTEKDDNLARLMRGKLLAEIGELRGLNSRDLESIKAFVSRQQEQWVPKYREFSANYLRRIIFIGSTNADEFLSDETGNRRFLPVKTPLVNVAKISKDCLLLWAEAREFFKVCGVLWRGVEELAQETHADYMITDPWKLIIEEWLETPNALTEIKPIDREYIQVNDVLREALSIDGKLMDRRAQVRVGKILRACGYVRSKVRVGKDTKTVFITQSSLTFEEVENAESLINA